MSNEAISRLERIAEAPGRATMEDVAWLVAETKRLRRDHETMCYAADKLAEIEAELECLRGDDFIPHESGINALAVNA